MVGRKERHCMTSLIISDLHLSDNPLEEYRFYVFDWLEELKEQYDIENIFLLGDITEKKDHHSAKLVNMVAEELNALASNIYRLWILRGNHDGVDPSWPFFKFLQTNNRIMYITEPTYAGSDYLFLPHSKDPANEWPDFIREYIEDTKFIFMHQTVKGAKSSNGFLLEGLDPNIFSKFNGLCFSGDIHTPQEVGSVIYVGSPYPVNFGDDFTGGAILLDGNKWERIEYESIKRVMLDLDYTPEVVNPLFEVDEGDQFKIRMKVNRSDSNSFNDWKKDTIEYVKLNGGIVVSIELKLAEEKLRLLAKRKFKNTDPLTVFNRFCAVENLDTYYKEVGIGFIEK